METNEHYTTIKNSGTKLSNSSAILEIVETFIKTDSIKNLDISQLKRFKECLVALYDSEVNRKEIKAKTTTRDANEDLSESETRKVYIFSTDLPKAFYTDLSSAKVSLLFEILDTYILIGKMTNEIRQELKEDLELLLHVSEPHIAGCGQITEEVC